MSNFLLVPVHLDALVLDRDQMVVEATADFSRLPFCTGKRDINPDVANISEEIVSTPFGSQNLLLKKGIHLHWSLPDSLTKARPNPDRPEVQDFPRVPNRWLATRCNKSGVVEKEWLIESDYLLPPAKGSLAGSGVSMPYHKDDAQPFRYMGRSLELPAADRDQGNYYPKLTAVGYGEPTFAAFYPNCYSVFGFCDEDYSGTNDERQYYVTGWYSNQDQDVLNTHIGDVMLFRPSDFIDLKSLAVKIKTHSNPVTYYLYRGCSAATQAKLDSYNGSGDLPQDLQQLFVDDLNRILKAGPDLYKPDRWVAHVQLTESTKAMATRQPKGPESVYVNRLLMEEGFPAEIVRRSQRLPGLLKESFKWTYIQQDDYEFPMRTVCFARLVLGQAEAQAPLGGATVAIGNTGTEALSVCLAQRLPGNAPKRVIEDQLEALHLAPSLEYRQLDVAAKFEEGRHEKGFAAVSGGTIWGIQAETNADAPARVSDKPIEIKLPDKLGHLLNTVNERQAEYDRTWQQIESLRVQLFSDWYKYMLCSYPPESTRDEYPDVDKVESYITSRVTALDQRLAHAGTITLNEDGGKVVANFVSARSGARSSLAAKLANAINEVQAFLDSQPPTAPVYRLKQTSGPRYWLPSEPSILVDGKIANPSKRHGKDGRPSDGLLMAQILPSVAKTTDMLAADTRTRIKARIDGVKSSSDPFAFPTWKGQPWNPFLIEWEVEVFPVEFKSNIDPATGRYQEDFITANYQLVENDVDLSLKPGRGAWTLAANIYSGRSILTPHATEQLAIRSEGFIQREVVPEYLRANKLLRSTAGPDFLKSNMKKVRDWYENSLQLRGENASQDPTLTAFRAWDATQKPESLSQSLGGFNEALLMHKQTLQLHIADPIGFQDYQPFANHMSEAVRHSIYSAPEPLNDFNPIRTGMMKIHRLRIIDTFGQTRDLDVSHILTSEPLDDGTPDPLINLPPRLTQPARVNFRWLSAEGDQEMNDHPATTPICGWVLANHLDDSLMVYDNDGKALGSLATKDKAVVWVPAPGGTGTRAVKEIANRHLNKVVTAIQQWGPEFLDDFISALDSAVANIEPENFSQHQDLALLMGRPLALVRASVNLELKGLPATHQGWSEFRQDLERDEGTERDDNGFSRVRFPIRIGEYRQFNDGTVGYWKEQGDAYEDNAFFAPQSDVEGAHLKTHKSDPEAMVFFQTVESPAQTLSLLIDPRGLVHATTGILPVKAINIPPDQYSAALQAIEITFLSTPIMTDAGKIHLPLPEEAGYQWSWLQVDGRGEWSEVSSRGLLRRETVAVAFESRAEDVWKDLVAQGWIKVIDPTRASVTAKDDRSARTLSTVKDLTDKIEDLLDRAHIGPVDTAAKFSGPQEIREGWLKLSAADRKQTVKLQQ